MKKFFTILIAFLAIFSIVSCAEPIDDTTKPEELTGLDAWRQVKPPASNKTKAIDITVTGTVAAKDGKYNTYIVDGKEGALLINGEMKDLKPGDNVKLKITSMKNFFGKWEAESKNVEVLENTAGTVPTPKSVTTVAEFNALKGTGYHLDYVSIIARTVSVGNDTFKCILLDSMPEINADLDKEPEGYKENDLITVHSKYNLHDNGKDVREGDLCVFTGAMSNFNNKTQLEVINTEIKHQMPLPQVEAATFDDLYNNPASVVNKVITGHIVYSNGKNLSIADKDTGRTIFTFADVNTSARIGDEVKFIIKKTELRNGILQVTGIDLYKTGNKISVADLFANAKVIKTGAELEAYAESNGTGNNRYLVKLENFTITKENKGKDNKKYGYYGKFGEENQTYSIDNYGCTMHLSNNTVYNIYGSVGKEVSGSGAEAKTYIKVFGPYYEKIQK